jgi:phage gpG-like protein
MKRLEGLAHPEAILIATGLLMNSFEYRALVNGVRLFNNRTFEDGTGAEIHQEGGFSPTSHNFIPARPMLPLTGEFPADWMIPVEDAIGDGIDRIFK